MRFDIKKDEDLDFALYINEEFIGSFVSWEEAIETTKKFLDVRFPSNELQNE